MEDQNDDPALGVPVMGLRSANPTRKVDAPATDSLSRKKAEYEGRHPGDELGLPKQRPTTMHTPTQQELAAIRAGQERQAQLLYQQVVEQSGIDNLSSWKATADKFVALAVVGLSALLGLFVFGQTTQILVVLAAQPLLLKILGYCVLGILLIVVAFFAIRLLLIFRKLRANQQISTAQLNELSKRSELRSLADRDKSKAKQSLEDYLRNFPLGDSKTVGTSGIASLPELGGEEIQMLRCEREFLLDSNNFAHYDVWLTQFDNRFQVRLQEAADRIIASWMRSVGVKTALSPNPMVDSAIVLYSSYGMIGDLCRLYNLRLNKSGMIRILALILGNTYLSGVVEDHIESVTEVMADLAQRIGARPALDALSTYTGGISDVAGAQLMQRASDGAVNAYLMKKLGRAAVRMLRPMEPRG